MRFKAVSSSSGPVWPEAASALAFATGFAYSTKERSSATVAISHRERSLSITQPSQSWKSSRRIASQIPKPITPTRPTTVVAGPDHRRPGGG